MKYSLTKTLKIACTLDSSEAIMFGKGGQHSLKLNPKDYDPEEGDDDGYVRLNLDSYDVIEITFQLDHSQKTTFDFVTSQAKEHREQWDKINLEEKQAAAERMKSYHEMHKKGRSTLPLKAFLEEDFLLSLPTIEKLMPNDKQFPIYVHERINKSTAQFNSLEELEKWLKYHDDKSNMYWTSINIGD